VFIAFFLFISFGFWVLKEDGNGDGLGVRVYGQIIYFFFFGLFWFCGERENGPELEAQ
jgi:hypothetical protein